MYSKQGKLYCDNCKIVAKKTNKELDCDECPNKAPELDYNLGILFDCFILCESQIKMGFGGVYAIDYSIICKVAEAHGIEANKTFFRLLKIYEGAYLERLHAKN